MPQKTALLVVELPDFEIGFDYFYDITVEGYKVYDNEGVVHKLTKEDFNKYFIID